MITINLEGVWRLANAAVPALLARLGRVKDASSRLRQPAERAGCRSCRRTARRSTV